MLTRRDFLQDVRRLLALAPTRPRLPRPHGPGRGRAGRDGRVLVVVQLDGGNDGINTVVPFADEGYAKHRKALRLPAEQLAQARRRGRPAPGAARRAASCWRPGGWRSCRGSATRTRAGRTSRAWPSGTRPGSTREEHTRARLARPRPRRGRRPATASGVPARRADGRPRRRCAAGGASPRRSSRLEDFALPSGRRIRPRLGPRAAGDDLAAFVRRQHARRLRRPPTALAELARAGDDGRSVPRHRPGATGCAWSPGCSRPGSARASSTPCRAATTPTPPSSARTPALLAELAGALAAFLDDLAAAKLADRVAVLAFSEFGRRVAENGSAGTDHGTAGPVFLAGRRQAGLVGARPA